MMDADKLAAFVVVTGLTSLVPGPSMLLVMSQSIWRGARSGAAALAGLQLGYIVWWLLAALGLGTLAKVFPLAFHALALGGALYLAWLGVRAMLHNPSDVGAKGPAREPSRHAMRDGILVALSNPKSMIYIVALLPPFVDPTSPVGRQLVVLAVVAMTFDVALGALYIIAGSRLASAMTAPHTRRWLDRAAGMIFIAIAAAIMIDLLR